ncbi:SNF2 family N-terminal domain-containing protein [Abortiporus biennis]|nr:SNF2 family N-terminal domain-containing protein [Abortiporus biennis]
MSHCTACGESGPSNTPFFDTQHFLPAGVLSLSLRSQLQCTDEMHRHPDGWYFFPRISQILTVDFTQVTLVKMLNFLVDHHFLFATYHPGEDHLSCMLYARIYLIPYDLNNVQGVLRRREKVKVLDPAQKYLRVILPLIARSESVWNGDFNLSSYRNLPFLDNNKDDRTMAEIFSSLSSPLSNITIAEDSEAYSVLHGTGKMSGMRSTLHPYQRRSVAAMMEKELHSRPIPDPLYLSIRGIDGRIFYMQPATLEVLSEQPMVSQSNGGILCEELGTGKTVMILALVLATLGQISAPEESVLDVRPILTPLALRTFPYPPFSTTRQHLAQGDKRWSKRDRAVASSVPSLRQLLIHQLRTQTEHYTPQKVHEALEDSGLWPAYRNNTPFYLHHISDPMPSARSRRRKADDIRPRVVFLTSATLVVVPPNLLAQWKNEIYKHCEDSLRVYFAEDNTPLLPATQMASDFDIILMTHPRLAKEDKRNKIEKLHTWKLCRCVPSPNSKLLGVPSCQCNQFFDVSPLLQIRWKRLVIDEGHGLANDRTNLASIIKSLSVERMWVVTGTPTTNLMGLQFGVGSELQYPEDDPETVSSDPTVCMVHMNFLRLLTPFAFQLEPSLSPSSPDNDEGQEEIHPEEHTRVWTKNDREDLKKLEHIIIDALQVSRFAADSKLFSSNIIAPLMDPSGPLPGSIQVLVQVMESVMIRHRIEDVEEDVLLPILMQETVLLDLDVYGVKTYNVMQAVIAINAIDSERTDIDYFFHQKNTTYLQTLVGNISQAMFWHIDEKVYNVDEIVGRADTHLKNAEKLPPDSADIPMLRQALQHVKSAAQDLNWRALQFHPYVFHRVVHLRQDIFDAWSQIPFKPITDIHHSTPYHLCSPEHMYKLRDIIVARPFSSSSKMIEWGKAIMEEEQMRLQFNLSRLAVSKTNKKHHKNEDKNAFLKNQDVAGKAHSTERVKELQKELVLAQERIKSFINDPPASPEQQHQPLPSQSSFHKPASTFLAHSPLAPVRIQNSTSSKLNHIIKDIMQWAHVDKYLIFSSSPLNLAYISEALELVQIKCLHFTSLVDRRQREQYVTTFETSETYRVFLMELKHGARGLNLISANRIIFCEPVLQADQELQAIKRCHRIGQTKAVTVKVLAIKSTFEELMVKRREAIKTGKITKITDDRTIYDFIEVRICPHRHCY